MTLNLITFSSAFQGQTEEAVRLNHAELLDGLSAAFDVHVAVYDAKGNIRSFSNPDALTLVFIASGGTEGQAVRHFSELPKPLVLLTDGKANSLAASMELSCWVRQQGERCSILHGETSDVICAINNLQSTEPETKCVQEVVAPREPSNLLKGLRIGVLGEPSDWLVSSDVDYQLVAERWGVEYVDIPLQRVNDYFVEVPESLVSAESDAFIGGASSMEEPCRNDILKAYRLYRAIRRIVDEEHLDAITVKCFDLIPTTCTTGCLALALLNDEGVPAGCEGDLQSIFTMLLCQRLTGVDAFMANPSWVRKNEVLFAHCTIGLRQVDNYVVRSHFESGIGVAIQGILPIEQTITVVKFGGKSLEHFMALPARLVENQDDSRKCRTQILLRTTDAALSTYLLSNSIGNHHIILQGDYVDAIHRLATSMGLQDAAK